MSEHRATPSITICDRTGDNIRGSWKSSTALADIYLRSAKHIDQVAVRSFERVISDQHTIIKMDIEGSELALLSQPRDWKRVRILVFEFSAARCRHLGVGPLPFVSVLKALRQGGFTHLSIPLSSKIRKEDFWRSDAHQKHLDFMVWCYREQADSENDIICGYAVQEMKDEMNSLPDLLQRMPFPEKKASRIKFGLTQALCFVVFVASHGLCHAIICI